MSIYSNAIQQWIKRNSSRSSQDHVTSSYMVSSQVAETFTSITPHRIELECGRSIIKNVLKKKCLSWNDVSTDIQLDLPGYLIRSGHLAWPKVRFWNWLFGVKLHTFQGVSTRRLRRCFAFSLLFFSSKVIYKDVNFIKKQRFFLFDLLWKNKM